MTTIKEETSTTVANSNKAESNAATSTKHETTSEDHPSDEAPRNTTISLPKGYNNYTLKIGDLLTADPGALSIEQLSKLQEHEATIDKGQHTFLEVGTALAAISRGGLFRSTHGTFADYVKDRWGFTRQRAHQLIDASDYRTNLAAQNTNALKITTERATRELMKVPNDRVAEVLEAVIIDGAPTAERIAEVRNRLVPQKPKKASVDKKPALKLKPAIKAAQKWADYLAVCNAQSLNPADAKSIKDLHSKTLAAFDQLKFSI